LVEASSLVELDFRKTSFFPFKLDQQNSGLVLLVPVLVSWFSSTSSFLVLLVFWYFWFPGTSGFLLLVKNRV
jgi:hypothetical protein